MSFGPHLLLALLEGAVTACVLAVTALGLSLVFGVMRIVNVAHGEFYMLGAVVAWFCASLTGGSPLGGFLLALVCAPLVVAGLAIATDWLVLRRVNYHPESTIVATIGLLYLLQQAVLSGYGPDARPVEAPIYFRVAFPLVRLLRLQAHRHRRLRALAARNLGGARQDPRGTVHARHAAGRGNGARPRRAGAPGVHRGVRRGRHARGGGGRAHRPHPAGPLSHGPRPVAAFLSSW